MRVLVPWFSYTYQRLFLISPYDNLVSSFASNAISIIFFRLLRDVVISKFRKLCDIWSSLRILDSRVDSIIRRMNFSIGTRYLILKVSKCIENFKYHIGFQTLKSIQSCSRSSRWIPLSSLCYWHHGSLFISNVSFFMIQGHFKSPPTQLVGWMLLLNNFTPKSS